MPRLLRATLSVIAVVLATNWCMGQAANCSSYNFPLHLLCGVQAVPKNTHPATI
jgi:hypothetical protein